MKSEPIHSFFACLVSCGGQWFGLGVLALAPFPALAITDCTIGATVAAFGNYDGTQNDTGASTISGSCSRGNNPDPDINSPIISLSAGVSGGYASRQMANGTNRLNYNLFIDVNRTTVWGDGIGSTSTVAALNLLGNGRFLNPNQTRNFSFTAYGRTPASQSVASGSYSDSITITLTF